MNSKTRKEKNFIVLWATQPGDKYQWNLRTYSKNELEECLGVNDGHGFPEIIIPNENIDLADGSIQEYSAIIIKGKFVKPKNLKFNSTCKFEE
jgi:hypothetical protein